MDRMLTSRIVNALIASKQQINRHRATGQYPKTNPGDGLLKEIHVNSECMCLSKHWSLHQYRAQALEDTLIKNEKALRLWLASQLI